MDIVRSTSTRAARIRAARVAVAVIVVACGGGDRTAARPADTASASRVADAAASATPLDPRQVVDSILPIEEALRHFQAGLPAPDRFANGARSRDALVRRFVDRLAARDTAALRALTLTRAEFGHLVYPRSSYTRPPYRTAPGLVWMQIAAADAKGIRRLLRPDLRVDAYVGHRCLAAPVIDGTVTLWRKCRVTARLADGDTLDAQLFGVIVERDGRFKFVNYDTDF